MRARLLPFALLLTLGGVSVAQEAAEPQAAAPPYVRLRYAAVTEHEATTEELAADPHFQPRTESTLDVVLGPRLVEIVEDGRRRRLEYATGRELVIDPESGTYTSAPLIQRFGFQHMELRNRLKMREALGAADVTDPSLAPRELSILFGRRTPGDDADSTTHTTPDGTVVFSLDGDEVARWTLSPHELDGPQREALARALQAVTHLHADARSALADAGRAPATLRARWRNVGTRNTATWTLREAVRESAAPPGVDGLARTFTGSELAPLAEGVLGATGADVPGPPDRDAFATSAEEAAAAGRHRDAMLLLLESSLSNGDPMSAEIEAVLANAEAVQVVRALMRVVALANTHPETALEQMDKIDRSAFTRPHVLDVFRANALTNADRRGEARDLLVATLSEVPYLAAAYKDLGDLYYGEFMAREAWLAWEMGRAIAPEHPIWQTIETHEARLRELYAELL